MLAPPPNGNVYDFVAQNQTNPDAWGVVVAWDAYKAFIGTALPGFTDDMQNINGVAI